MTEYRYNFDAICQLCGDLYLSHGIGRVVCYKCEENVDFVNRYTCSGCGGYFPNIKLSPNGMCSKCQRILVSNRVVTKKCKACQEQFHCFSSTTKYCNSCSSAIDFIAQNTCSICKYFDPYAEREYDQNHRGYTCGCVENFHKDFNKRKKIEHSQLGKCKNPNCETPNELTYDRNPINGYCKNCSSKVTQSYMKSNLNGGLCKNTDCLTPTRINDYLHPVNGYCKDCRLAINQKVMENRVKDGLCKCKTCKHKDRINEVLNRINGYCSDCMAENLSENFKAIPNFVTKNNILFYKDMEWNDFSKKILSGELNANDYPGVEIRCGVVTYRRENPLTGDRILFRSNLVKINDELFYYDQITHEQISWKELSERILAGELDVNDYPGLEIRFGKLTYNRIDPTTDEKLIITTDLRYYNDVLYYYDGSIKNYVLWEEYKKKFELNNIRIDEISNEFKLYPTFRQQDSENWGGARSAFEQSLVDDEIGYFVYIKFYIDEYGASRPLVVGKTGSRLVNSNGTDVIFSTSLKDGPSRRFLKEQGLQWDKTKIAIMKCKNEKEALQKEKEVQKELNLFES